MKNESANPQISLVWLRRDLRLHDHAAFSAALAGEGRIQPVFVFDTDILSRFSCKKDRRLTFIMSALWKMHRALAAQNSGVLVLHGRAQEIIPELARILNAQQVTCARDFEPATKARDDAVGAALAQRGIPLRGVVDHLIHSPEEVLKADGTPYLVFTPYSKAWRARLHQRSFAERPVPLQGRLADYSAISAKAEAAGLRVVPFADGVEQTLAAIGYDHAPHPLWTVEAGDERLRNFIAHGLNRYKSRRDFMAEEGTSRLSPYLRHGLLSIREVARLAVEQAQPDTWLNELIWREFYAMIFHHFPDSANQEWQEKYRRLRWPFDPSLWESFTAARTGYPIIDAAMRELHETGWMHNRARMLVASFLTKDLHLDWRLGEEHFAQWLMDYELASNVGGWQWAASTGTDAAPYFRIFNPVSQSRRFDPQGGYIRRWLPELRELDDRDIHLPPPLLRPASYPAPVVDHAAERGRALAMFREAGE